MAGRGGRLLLISIASLAALLMVTLVAAQSTSTATVEVRVWRHVEDPERLHLSTRPAEGRWVTHQTPLDMSELSRSGNWYQSSIVSVDVEVPAAVVGPEPSELYGIDETAACAAVVALAAEHASLQLTVISCEAEPPESGDRHAVRGTLAHRGNNAWFDGTWTEATGLTSLAWIPIDSRVFVSQACQRVTPLLAEQDHRAGACAGWASVAGLQGDNAEPHARWLVYGAMRAGDGPWFGFAGIFRDGEEEAVELHQYGSSDSPFYGIDFTPECKALVAFVEEHFAETTSITSCQGQADGPGSLRGLLEHRGEPAYFDGAWSEDGGITSLNWIPTVVWPAAPAYCQIARDWLVQHDDRWARGHCRGADATVVTRDGGSRFIDWNTLGLLEPGAGGSAVLFEAWVGDGGERPWAWRIYGEPGPLEFSPNE
ncbi:MAG: hypothetical protein OXH41_04155 [Chloroflexi bacterium]|nr:hypothetical protein [Chloroflexota bacterium]